MTVEIGWWARDAEGKRVQINVRVFGGAIEWRCQRGRFTSWEPYEPTEEDWEHLRAEAEKRVPRRTIHAKVVDLIRNRGA